MKYLFIILSMSILLSGELEVDGNLTVTGTIQNQTIDSLRQVIADQQQQINNLNTLTQYLTLLLDIPLDCSGVAGGSLVVDCTGECGGSAIIDVCGVCNGENTTCPTVNDIDGNIYAEVQIGEQIWMQQNLKTTRYKNGDAIQEGFVNDMTEGAYTVYDDELENAEIYGNLYNWYAAVDPRGVCPEGFHVPSDVDWLILTDYLGGADVAGGKMKSTGTIEIGNGLWYSPNEGASNESGFTALPAGYLYGIPAHSVNMGTSAPIFSSTPDPTNDNFGKYLSLRHDGTSAEILFMNKNYGCMSVRCIKD